MSRYYPLIILLVVGGTISMLATLFLLNRKPTNTAVNPSVEAIPTVTQINVPVNISDKAIAFASINYGFNGTITDIKTIPEGFELVTDIQTPNIPKFTVCITCQQQTTVFGTFQNGLRQVNVQMLAQGQKVRIVTTYDLKTSKWTTTRVNILDKLTLPTSAPRNPQIQTPSSTPPISPSKQ